MRERFSLDLANLDRLCVLIFGGYGVGKTHLVGDFLTWAKSRGPARFLNVRGEDGSTSLAHMGLGDIGETVSTLKDYKEALADYQKEKLVGLGVDSLIALFDLVLTDTVGEPRFPDPAKDGEKARRYWSDMRQAMKDMVTRSRAASSFVLWVAAHDKSEDSITGQKATTPDLPGKLAQGIAGSFDFVGYLTAETLGADRVQRRVTFAPSASILTRQRIPRAITTPVSIPQGGGGWQAIYQAMEQALKPVNKETKNG